MRQQRTFLLLAVIVAVLIMGIGYAAITNVNLKITGNVTGTADQANFKVKFTGTPTFSGTGSATLKITGDTTATMDVTGLTAKGDTLTAKFTIANNSPEIWANITSSVTNSNTTYFSVTSEFSEENYYAIEDYDFYQGGAYVGYRIAPGGTATLSITVKLLKTPVSSSQTATIGVTVTAIPDYYYFS